MNKLNAKQIINSNLIILDSNAKNKEEAFEEVSSLAFKNKIINNEKDMYDGLVAREKETSTGLEDGFAIPHSRSKKIKKAAVFFVKFKKSIKWETFDNKPVKVAIFLAIPENESVNLHISVLSEIAQKLLNKNTRDFLKKENDKNKIINKLFENEQKNEKEENYKGYVIGITACPAGVAHTYMSAKAIEDFAKARNYKVKIEKQGANGIEDELTNEDIRNANFMILAVDVNPAKMDRFNTVPQLRVPVAEPLRNMEDIWNKALTKFRDVKDQILNTEVSKFEANKINGSFLTRFKTKTKAGSSTLKNAILTGISYTVPVIVAGTVIVALVTIIQQIAGAENIKIHANWLNTLSNTAGGALSILLAPLLSGYIAYALADKPGLFPGFLGGLACNAVNYNKIVNGEIITVVAGLGFLGGLISGIIVGYMMKFSKKYIVNKKIQGVITWFIYPVFGSLLIMCLILFGIGKPIALLVSLIYDGLTKLQNSKAAFVMGAVVGLMCVSDLGGPFNKVAWAFAFASMSGALSETGEVVKPELLVPYSAFWAAGIGTGWTTTIVTIIGRKHCNDAEKEAGKISWLLSSLGITEGSIPLALSDPGRVLPSFMLGGAISGGLTSAFNLGSNIPGGGFITMAGISFANGSFSIGISILLWFTFALTGTLLSSLMLISLKMLKSKKTIKKVQENTKEI
ncbi:PTS system, 2-O-A-mannosyl-D-glycerate-specific IIA component [Williamsoniiplasma somnilux]|uniref:PTS system, 2-O-A-mannosyl-D-glycerate-specific IIA component n=1 Tax=Williamsoniiplasma somnilux TaxID=215578 RepID=A0A2K8NYS0_9MOLU|nr:fructose-specific PTS transporter subunit EIIC [Williamsoniiplasma somnilux]ATZ18706.1 PTS system, 2-O-A-mannosyl-D-glycerate-specific IIA component [Williamsoniiplasma somnilux]